MTSIFVAFKLLNAFRLLILFSSPRKLKNGLINKQENLLKHSFSFMINGSVIKLVFSGIQVFFDGQKLLSTKFNENRYICSFQAVWCISVVGLALKPTEIEKKQKLSRTWFLVYDEWICKKVSFVLEVLVDVNCLTVRLQKMKKPLKHESGFWPRKLSKKCFTRSFQTLECSFCLNPTETEKIN